MKRISRQAGLALGMFSAVWLIIYYACVRSVDTDFGWHYRSGVYIVAHGVPMHDIFSYTASSYLWVNAEWLNDIIMTWLSNLGGYNLLAIVYGGIWTAALALVVRRPVSWPVIVAALAALVPYLGIRSIVWSVLGVALVLQLALKPRRWWLLPVIFLPWANLHAGFALGLVILTVYAICLRSWRLGAWTTASVAVTFINPYGWRLYHEVWQTMTDAKLHSLIVEWWPLSFTPSNIIFVSSAIAVVGVVRFSWPRRIVGGLLVLATLSANRQLPFLVLAMTQPVSDVFVSGIHQVRVQRPRLARGMQLALCALAVLALLSALFKPLVTIGGPRLNWPYRSALALQEQPCRGQLFNDYSFGGYIIWKLPGTKVYIDGRMPSWRGPEGRYLDRWQKVLSDPDYMRSEFTRYNVNCVLILNADHTLMGTLKSDGWRKAVAEPDDTLWRRD